MFSVIDLIVNLCIECIRSLSHRMASESSSSSDDEFREARVTRVTIPELEPIRVPLAGDDDVVPSETAGEEAELPSGLFDDKEKLDELAQFNAEIAELGDMEAEAVSKALMEELADPAPLEEADDWEQLRKEELESIVQSGFDRRAKKARQEDQTSDDASDDDWRAKSI